MSRGVRPGPSFVAGALVLLVLAVVGALSLVVVAAGVSSTWAMLPGGVVGALPIGIPGGAGESPGGPGASAPGVPGSSSDGASPAARLALVWALARVGTPYRWGGTGPEGFDCSGLVQQAYASAGVHLPRVAQDQYDAGPQLVPGVTVVAGDLVFFGSSPTSVEHVGIAVGDGTMVDAPHQGASVRVEAIWSGDYLGATRPAP